jgi:hypothetical protein
MSSVTFSLQSKICTAANYKISPLVVKINLIVSFMLSITCPLLHLFSSHLALFSTPFHFHPSLNYTNLFFTPFWFVPTQIHCKYMSVF